MAGGASFGEAIANTGADFLVDTATDYSLSKVNRLQDCFCFVEGTPVLTALGLVAIETVAVGDIVIATDPETGETAEKEVLHTFVNETDELVHLTVNGEEIVSTPGHKFYAPEKGWTSAIDLCEGDILVLVNGEYVVVEQVQHEILETPVKVYNFEVEDFHTYYVGEQSVLVHNEGCGKSSNDAIPAVNNEAEINISTEHADFIVTQNGVAIPVPEGAVGPIDVKNKSGNVTGFAFVGGTDGTNGQVSTVRVMDATPARGNSPGYPNGYVVYSNPERQNVNPSTGKVVPRSEAHYPL